VGPPDPEDVPGLHAALVELGNKPPQDPATLRNRLLDLLRRAQANRVRFDIPVDATKAASLSSAQLAQQPGYLFVALSDNVDGVTLFAIPETGLSPEARRVLEQAHGATFGLEDYPPGEKGKAALRTFAALRGEEVDAFFETWIRFSNLRDRVPSRQELQETRALGWGLTSISQPAQLDRRFVGVVALNKWE